MKLHRVLTLLFALSVLLVACQPVSVVTKEPESLPTNLPTTVTIPTATLEPTVEESGAIKSMDEAKAATIQIEAQGSFVDPEFGQMLNTAGRGSGFIIDPSGIAITNNHVVTGAAILKVWVGGDTKPKNARVLGVSECWDLAVIDIDGDDYPYFDWYTGKTDPGVEVYAAGFPLGDPEYTLTKGIISKANAGGETSWASVDAVIEHDARIRPGNSGGPLLSQDAEVVGINYAGSDKTDMNFAINSETAQSVIDILKSGKDFESIGVNGSAIANEDGSLTGIWVASVKSGSPADKAGIQGGDVITKLEGLVLATDGTMADYCDILRTRSETDTYSVQVLRFASQEVMEGQINGRKLEQSFSFAQQLPTETAPEEGNTTAAPAKYATVRDDNNAIEVNIPASWTEVDGSNWIDGGEVIGASISASADLKAFNDTYSEPGIFFGATAEIAKLGGYVQLLDVYRDVFRQDCKLDGRYDYSDAVYEGKYDLYTDCVGAANTMIILSARPITNPTSMLITVLMNMMTDADVDALDEALATFNVVGNLP